MHLDTVTMSGGTRVATVRRETGVYIVQNQTVDLITVWLSDFMRLGMLP